MITTTTPMNSNGLRDQIAGVGVAELAREYGTPLYAYDAEMIRRRCRDPSSHSWKMRG